MSDENTTTPAVAETAAATEENSQAAAAEEKKHDVEYADEEAKGAVSTTINPCNRSHSSTKVNKLWLNLQPKRSTRLTLTNL